MLAEAEHTGRAAEGHQGGDRKPSGWRLAVATIPFPTGRTHGGHRL